jgi:hypothetical protein
LPQEIVGGGGSKGCLSLEIGGSKGYLPLEIGGGGSKGCLP